MRRTFIFGAVMVSLAAFSPADVFGQKKAATTAQVDPLPNSDYTILARKTKIDGIFVSSDGKSITIKIPHDHMVKNTAATTQPARPSKKGTTNNNANKIQHDFYEIQLAVQEKAGLRRKTLPSGYDEKGNIKTYTDAEKAKLRGPNQSLPGYLASLDDLQAGAVVSLTLDTAKKPYTIPAGVKPVDAPEPTEEQKPTVKMIMLISDPPDAAKTAAPKAKKAN